MYANMPGVILVIQLNNRKFNHKGKDAERIIDTYMILESKMKVLNKDFKNVTQIDKRMLRDTKSGLGINFKLNNEHH